MFAIEKKIDGKNVGILVDFHGNGRLFIDGNCICDLSFTQEKGRRFIENGWHVAPNTSCLMIQSGSYKGSPKIAEYCEIPKYRGEVEMLDTYKKDGNSFFAPIAWIDDAISLIIAGDFETLRKKRIMQVSMF